LKITTIDIDSRLASNSVQVLENSFNTKINFIHGDSLNVLSELNLKFDLIHIDGSHNEDYVTKEFEMCKKFLKSNIYKVLFDDIESIPNLEKHILSTYKVIKYIKPNCKWNNCYFEIEL
jgi:predicted O-methyltransferase YrrM